MSFGCILITGLIAYVLLYVAICTPFYVIINNNGCVLEINNRTVDNDTVPWGFIESYTPPVGASCGESSDFTQLLNCVNGTNSTYAPSDAYYYFSLVGATTEKKKGGLTWDEYACQIIIPREGPSLQLTSWNMSSNTSNLNTVLSVHPKYSIDTYSYACFVIFWNMPVVLLVVGCICWCCSGSGSSGGTVTVPRKKYLLIEV